MLGLRFCARAFSSCSKRGPLFIAVRGPLTIAASLVAEHRLQMRRLSSCGPRAQSLRGMWDLPGPGLEPVSPALAGRFSTTAPPGKPRTCFYSDGGFLRAIWGHWQMENVVGLSFFLYRMRSIIQKYLLMKKIYQNIDSSFLWKCCHAGVFKTFFWIF